ncbi:MAG: HYR domain-containing protein [Bacteroidetes bacterium]|nr:MAG: HYR domain-containing protein [Bacteroidota bacterium]
MKTNLLMNNTRTSFVGVFLTVFALLFSYKGEAQCTTPSPGEVSIEIVMRSVSFSTEMYWTMSDSTTNTQLASVSSGTYPTNLTVYDGSYLPQHLLCVPIDQTLKLDAFDSFGDGWNNGELIVRYNESKDTIFQYSMPNTGGAGIGGQTTVYFPVPEPPTYIHICNGDVAPPFNNLDSISGGSGNFMITWEQSMDKVNWSSAPGDNDSLSYQLPGQQFDTKYFRRKVVDLTCGDSAYSNVITLSVPDSLKIDSADVQNVACYGTHDGQLQAYVSGGRPPYIYSWNTGDSTAVIDSLDAGVYTLTVTDRTGCSFVDSFEVTQPAPLAMNITLQKSVDCPGFSDGELLAVPVNGVPPFTYLWSNGDTTAVADSISAGTYYVTMTDSLGCQGLDTIVVTDFDTVKPTVIAQDVTVYLDNNGAASVTSAMVDNGSNDLCGILKTTVTDSIFDCSHLGANPRYFIVEDINGNIDSVSFIVTVVDTITPIARTKNTTLYLNANGVAVLNPVSVDAGSSDNCLITLSSSQDTFTCVDKGLQLRNLTVTDLSGNSATESFFVDVKDTISPTLVARTITVQLGATGQASISASQLDGGSTDNCSNLFFYSASKTSFNCSDLGVNSVTLTITDQNSNSTTGVATVIVEDNLNPSAQAQNLTVYLDANGLANITAAQANNGSTDNCSIDSMWVSQMDFTCDDLGSNSVSFTVSDTEGNTNTTNFIVSVRDTISPIATAQGQTIYLDGNGQASITTSMINNGSTDNCSISTITLDQMNFTCADLGTNTVNLTVSDASGNSSSASVTVTVMDTVSPIAMAQNLTISLNASGQASVTPAMLNNGSTDNCTISTITLSQSDFDCSDIGANTVVVTVTDNSNNQSTATAIVTVQDNIAPTVVTQNHTVYLDATGSATIAPSDIDNGSMDNCGIETYATDITLLDCADLGQNLVMLSVTDSSGNTASASAIVTVVDTVTPTLNNTPANITAYADAGQCGTIVQWPTITATDNCNSTNIISSSINGSLFSLGVTTVTVTANDPSGNSTTASFTVTVLDTISPMISNLPTNIQVVPNAGTCDAVATWSTPTATDNCGTPTLTSSHASGATFPVGTTTVTYTATDAAGNTRTRSFVVTVTDIVAPVIANVPANITVGSSTTSCGNVVNYPAATATDNCSSASLAYSHPSGTTFPVGTTTVTITATDGANNTSTATFNVTVVDDVKPVPTFVPASDTVGICNANYTYAPIAGTDNCGNVVVTQTSGLPSGSIFPAGITENVFRIRDNAGNDTIVRFTIVVVPGGQPSIPGLLEICENDPAVDITLGQSSLVWTGPGVVNGNTFDPQAAGAGRHQLNYTFTDDYNCTVSGNISVTVLPIPTKPVIIQLGTTTLGVQGTYTTYQWYRNGQIIPGAVNPTYSYNVGGNYQVMVGNSSGCMNYGDGRVVGTSGGGIGIEELDIKTVEVYPNPTDGLVNIKVNVDQSTDLQIELVSLGGQVLYNERSMTTANGLISLDFSHLPAATYILRISNDASVSNHRVIIK